MYNLRMRDLDSVEDHLNSFNNVVSQLVSLEIKISNEDKCIILLFSLLNSWDSLVVAIGSNTTTLKFDEGMILVVRVDETKEHGRTENICIICKRTLLGKKYIYVLKWEI
jgi:hypothetical protein